MFPLVLESGPLLMIRARVLKLEEDLPGFDYFARRFLAMGDPADSLEEIGALKTEAAETVGEKRAYLKVIEIIDEELRK